MISTIPFFQRAPIPFLLCAALAGCATNRNDEWGLEIACHNTKVIAYEHPAFSPVTSPAPTSEQPCSGATLIFNGSNLTDARLDFVSNALFIRFSESDSDGVNLVGFNPNDAFRSFSDTFVFSDGTVCANDVIAKGFDLEGTKENEIITGTNATDRISGHGGNDTLNGGDGDDIYYYAPGDGFDCISDRSGRDAIELKGNLSATNIIAGISTRDGQAIVRLRLRDSKNRVSKKDGMDVLLNSDGGSPIETVRFPDATTCAFSDILRLAPKLPTSSRKTSADTTCFHDPTVAHQAGLVNPRARAIILPPRPIPILDPTDSAEGQMIIMGSDGKPRLVRNKSVGPQETGE